MENRKGYINYLINGCRSAVGQTRAFGMSFGVSFGAKFFLGCFVLTLLGLVGYFFPSGAAIGSASLAGLMVKIKEDGLSGDNLTLVKELNKRFEALPDSPDKDAVGLQIRESLKPFETLSNFKDIDPEKLKELLGDSDKGIRSILLAQGQKLKDLEEKGGKSVEDLSIRAQIVKWRETNKVSLEALKNGQRANLTNLEIRAAASPMTPANTLTNTITVNAGVIPDFAPGFVDIRRAKPTLWDYIPKGRTSSAAYSWVNKGVDAATGDAAFIGPGVAKPGISFKLTREVSNAKKIAVSDKLAIELLDDVEGMESLVRGEMQYRLKKQANADFMTGVLSATVPAGLTTIAVPFSQAGLEAQDPNNFDAIRAIVAQLSVGFFAGLPVTVFVNPVDAANMDMTKAITQGVYVLPPFSTADGRQIAGATVVEDTNVAAGYALAACLDCWKTLIYKDFSISLGWENDDFTKNLVTYIAEMRVHSFYSANDAGFAIYDTFANIKAAIEVA